MAPEASGFAGTGVTGAGAGGTGGGAVVVVVGGTVVVGAAVVGGSVVSASSEPPTTAADAPVTPGVGPDDAFVDGEPQAAASIRTASAIRTVAIRAGRVARGAAGDDPTV